MPYIGKSPSAVGVRNRFYFTASGGETSLSGSDDNGKTLVFSDASYVDVILNGGNLVSGTDYTATPSTNTISGLTALVANDVVEIIAYDVFSVSDTVSAASGGTFQSNVNFDSGIDVTGNATFTDNGKAIFGAGSDLQIYHDGSNSIIAENSTGSLKIQGSDLYLTDDDGTNMLYAANNGGVTLYYGGGAKLATTATGVDVTGGLTTTGNVGIGGSETTVFNGVGGDMKFVVIGDDSTTTIANNSDAGIAIVNTNQTAGNLAGLHFARADTDDTPNYAGASIVAQFPEAQVTGQYPKGDLAFLTSTATNYAPSEKMRLTASGNVGIGDTSPSQKLNVAGNIMLEGSDQYMYLSNVGTFNSGIYVRGISGSTTLRSHSTGIFTWEVLGSEKMRLDSSGRLLIGTTVHSISGSQKFEVQGIAAFQFNNDSSSPVIIKNTNSVAGSGVPYIVLQDSSGNRGAIYRNSSNEIGLHGQGALTFHTGGTAPTTERMRILSTGDIAFGNSVANTASGYTNQPGGGYVASDSHFEFATTANRAPVEIGKNNANDGKLIAFRRQGTNLGTVGVHGGRLFIADQVQNTGISFYQACLIPTNINGAAVDNVYDCGHGSYRWDDIRATNGTIQTSDANEKQQIAALTNAEITAAKAISALFKTFKWNDAVAKKGDAARTHAGVIAQDVEAAMTAAGLDAGAYAFFISDTWWETQAEVPAVDAVDAVLDEDGNVVTEAVEAVAAYTRTDTYDTAEEAPEGATERTRMGIRYPELLSFIGAATEQRLSNIETRLAALEAN